MYVERILSLNGAWSILTSKKEDELQDALLVLEALDSEATIEIIGSKQEGGVEIDYLYNSLQTEYQKALKYDFDWTDALPLGIDRMAIYSDLPPMKNGVLSSFVGTDEMAGGDFASAAYLHIPFYFLSGVIDVALFFAPSMESINYFISIGSHPYISPILPTEDFCRAEMAKFSSLTSQTPIVLAFFSPIAPEKIIVEEIVPLKVSVPTIERTIEFAPEYYQAGVGLLSYFGEVLRQKDPSTKAKVRIEQDGRIVRLHIESPSGDIETIEKELDQYALVISNQAPPETLFEQRMHIMQLESRLEVAKVELKNAHDLKQLTEGFYSHQVRDLKQQVDSLTHQVATQLLQQDKTFNLMQQQTGSHERVQMAMLTHSSMLFKDLLQEASGNQRLLEAVSSLHQNLLAGITTIEIEDQLERALATIKEAKPSFLGRIRTQIEGAAYKAAAGSSISWIADWIIKHK